MEHFSAFKHFILASVAPLVYNNMTLPDVPAFTDSLVQKMVCSGIEPKLDTNRIPHPIDLLLYCANPLYADSTRLSNPFNSYWVFAREVPDPADDLNAYHNRLVQLGLRNGNESTLEAIVRYSSRNSISISDLFGEAYKLADGDYFQAMLLCHNVLRGHAYGGDGSPNNQYWGNRHDPDIQGNMQSILGYGDATGHRYHLFGMMLYGFIQSSVWKPAVLLINDQTNSDIYRELTVFLEEGIISGDLLTEPEEAAIDKEGFNTGRDFYTQVFNKSIIELKSDPNFALDACKELDVKITADPATAFVNESIYFNSIITGGEAPYVYYWKFGDGGTSNLKSDSYQYANAGIYTVNLTVFDANDLKGMASNVITVQAISPSENYAVWIHEDSRTCCPGDFGGVAPYQYHGTEKDQADQGAIILATFTSHTEMIDWTCDRTVHIAYNWVSNWAEIGGYIVTNLPCEANAPWEP